MRSQLYSHIVLIPVISAVLCYARKEAIFASPCYSLQAGTTVIFISLTLYVLAALNEHHLNENNYLSVAALSMVGWWIGGFIMIYGWQSFLKASFPLLFLLFIVPIPGILLDRAVLALQVGSTEAAYWIFKVIGVPFSRQGFIFSLPTLDIEVAPQCSGIRSALVLFIVGLLLGHLLLKTKGCKAILALCVYPIAIFKNGLRIVTLSVIATYVDETILEGSLHTSGGIPFFVLAVLFLLPVCYLLKRYEEKSLTR
jgi:exosortase